MIKVNLLPIKRKKKPKPVPPFIMAMVLLLTAAFVISAAGVFYMNAKISSLQRQKQENQQKIAELNKKIAEVKDFEKRNKIFTERKNIIEQLTRNQSLPVKILDEISMRLTEGVWLQSMDISEGTIKISGVGFSNSDIVSFVQSLKSSQLFDAVVLLGTNFAEQDGVATYKFDISFNVRA